MIHQYISDLVRDLDHETANYHTLSTLILYGSKDSKFLKAVKRKADIMGIATVFDDGNRTWRDNATTSFIADRETAPRDWYFGIDLDEGIPAVTQAIIMALSHTAYIHKKVAVVGRGYAARGLYKGLIDTCDSLTFVHSQTSHIYQELLNKDIIIICSPELKCGIPWSCNLVIDLSGAVKGYPVKEYVGMGEIGNLCTSILLNRMPHHNKLEVANANN